MLTANNAFVGVDIGSSKICAVICELDAAGSLRLKGIGTSVSTGLKKGRIENREEVFRSLDRALKRAEQTAGYRPSRVMTTVPFGGVQFSHNLGFVLSPEGEGKMGEHEKAECMRRSRNMVQAHDQTILHVIPTAYKVDGRATPNPLGQIGKHLEIQTHMVMCPKETLGALTDIYHELNLRIGGVMVDALAMSQVVLTASELQEGVILMDIGGWSTTVSIFKEGVLQQAIVVPIGGETVTADIAQCLDVSIPEAERLKIIYGDLAVDHCDPDKKIMVNGKNGREEVQKNMLCKVMDARMQELIHLVLRDLPYPVEPNYKLVLCGGGGQLGGLASYIRKTLGRPVREGLPEDMKAIIENMTYAPAVGTILYGIKTRAITYEAPIQESAVKKIRTFFQDFFE